MLNENHETEEEPGDLRPPIEAAPIDTDVPADILAAREQFLKEAILHILRQIRQRRRIRDANLERIDREECRILSELRQMPQSVPGYNKDHDRLRTQLEAEHERLELEKGREAAGYWKDVSTLQADLLTWIREHRSLVEKLETLTGHQYQRFKIEDLLKSVEGANEPQPAEGDHIAEPWQIEQLRRLP